MNLNKLTNCIVINSLTYFLLAYFVVAFSSNLFIILIAKLIGFDAVLSYNGFILTAGKWTNENIILIYFFGNLISLFLAVFFMRKYYINNRLRKKIKLLYLWIYIISLSWFFGEIIIGAIFQTGIGAALIAFEVPFFFRLLLSIICVAILVFLGIKTQHDVMYSANLYYPKLSVNKTGKYFVNQILLPALLGLLIIILLKLPNIGQYKFVDLYILLTILFFIIGVFYKYDKHKSFLFKNTEKNISTNECSITYLPIIILLVLIILFRVGLNNGISI